MDKTQKHNDLLEDLFDRMQDETLPASFRINVMQKVMKETVRIKRRNERFGLIAVMVASLLMIGLAGASFLYLGIPQPDIPMPDMSQLPFYTYIGILTLILLGADYKIRQIFKRKQLFHKDTSLTNK